MSDHSSPQTSGSPLRIVIVGAGIGGLTLAQALKRHSIRTQICEADSGPTARSQGYRLHLGIEAVRALKDALPSDLFSAFITLSEPVGRGFTFLDSQLKELVFFRRRDADRLDCQTRGISRFTLRQILINGLEQDILFSRRFVRGELLADRTIRAHFADGSSINCDLLVAADGTGSRTLQSLGVDRRAADSGSVTIYGKVKTTPEMMAMFSKGNFDHLGIAIGPGGLNFFLSLNGISSQLREIKEMKSPLSSMLDEEPGYSIWALVAKRSSLIHIGDLEQLSASALNAVAARAAQGFHPSIQHLVQQSIPGSQYLTSIREVRGLYENAECKPLAGLGDAVHAMSPVQGKGASTAILDAEDLTNAIKTYLRNPTSAHIDLSSYQKAMSKRGVRAVRRAGRIQRWVVSEGITRHSVIAGLRAIGLITNLYQKLVRGSYDT